MKLDPFIEAEEDRRSQRPKACRSVRGLQVRLLRAPQRPCRLGRDVTDAELTREDQRHPRRVQGHLWRPADAQGARYTATCAVRQAAR